MRERTMSSYALAVALLVWLLAPITLAQARGQYARGVYNPDTEVTVSGIVVSVVKIRRGNRSGGTHLNLKTSDATIDVRLGPSNFIEKQAFAISEGDQMEVTGSKVKVGEGEVLIAREIGKGDKTLTLRDSRGKPVWSGVQRY
ncbi:MAG TPA: DNA-binding protein [Blastocatellia bacterium]|nr:DNA-binding protein [Blastocatellia bacterium]